MKKLLCLLPLFSSTILFAMEKPTPQKDSNGRTSLMRAVLNQIYIGGRLSGERDIINEKDAISRTALHYAAANGDRNTMLLLINAGADQTLTDYEGKTAQELFETHKKLSDKSNSSKQHFHQEAETKPADNALKAITIVGTTDTWRQRDPGYTDYASQLR